MSEELSRSVSENSIRYAGWGVTAAAFAGVMVSFAPIIPYTFSLFLNPLHAAFGWKRQAMGTAFALAAMTVACVSPLIGLLLDRFPPRRILLPAIVIFSAALASLSRLGPGIARFYFTFFILGLVANGTAQFAYTRTVLTWFDRRRGLALALILTGSGVGAFIIPPLTQWVIQNHGWRDAYLTLGGIALLGIPLTALLVRNRPHPIQHRNENADSGATIGAAFRSWPFWILAIIIMLSAFSENGLVTNLAAILTEHGITASVAALALSVRGGCGIIGRLFAGILLDRFPAQRIQTFILLLSAFGTLILAYAKTPSISLIGAALLGAGLGSEADVAPYLLSRYFGRKHFSVLYGFTWTAYAIGGATGPMTIGHLYDRAGAYLPIFIVGLAGVAMLAVLFSLFLAPTKDAPFEHIEDAASANWRLAATGQEN
ncbi:MFS transporter [Silvibacterium dinghuense]|uniref:MFS transporter n=1 Tax=Silvibacterium dinghuense TaxID=1560006 RepID=A0A4V1NV84_9BACT|nr:MFS transporter [Silvibacterium dinghuense]RXS94880.1 MFS transporter [Silvibacterium dinghuense]GGH08693.1 MFS transporter [Silvibacterium dinghuense]